MDGFELQISMSMPSQTLAEGHRPLVAILALCLLEVMRGSEILVAVLTEDPCSAHKVLPRMRVIPTYLTGCSHIDCTQYRQHIRPGSCLEHEATGRTQLTVL